MKMGRWLTSGLVLALGIGCSKQAAEKREGAAPSSAPRASEGSAQSSLSEGNQSKSSKSETAPLAAAPAELSNAEVVMAQSEPPTSFAGAKKEAIDGAVGLGCEARSAAGWLELICRKKNGTGGHPIRAELDANADAGEAVQADEHGELRLVLPFREGSSKEAKLEWSDTKYLLHVRDASAKLEWSGANLSLRRACAALGDESRAVLSAAQKAEAQGRVLPSEAARLPRFATCIQAGHGSWALGLKSIVGTGEGAERKLTAEVDLVHVSESGQRHAGALGAFEFAPAGLEFPALQAYDYDDDGNDEAILSYELRARPPGASLPEISALWSFSESGVAPYAKAPRLAAGSSGTEHLEFDMRPDLGDYGPFIAWLAPGCGLKDCPPRLTGPRFFWHSLPDGGFSNSDASAKAALKRACPKKPASAVVEAGEKLNATLTAKTLVCARAWGATAAQVETELSSKATRICGEAASCPLLETLQAWAKAELPLSIDP